VHGPRRASPGIYDAWLASLRSADPRFEFAGPPFRQSLLATLAFAAAASRPTAVLTGPGHLTAERTGWEDRAVNGYRMVRVRLNQAAYRECRARVERRCATPASADLLRHRRRHQPAHVTHLPESPPVGPPTRRPLPGADPASARPWRPHQRIRAGRLKTRSGLVAEFRNPTGLSPLGGEALRQEVDVGGGGAAVMTCSGRRGRGR
jgi:hypothetical protein